MVPRKLGEEREPTAISSHHWVLDGLPSTGDGLTRRQQGAIGGDCRSCGSPLHHYSSSVEGGLLPLLSG